MDSDHCANVWTSELAGGFGEGSGKLARIGVLVCAYNRCLSESVNEGAVNPDMDVNNKYLESGTCVEILDIDDW